MPEYDKCPYGYQCAKDPSDCNWFTHRVNVGVGNRFATRGFQVKEGDTLAGIGTSLVIMCESLVRDEPIAREAIRELGGKAIAHNYPELGLQSIIVE